MQNIILNNIKYTLKLIPGIMLVWIFASSCQEPLDYEYARELESVLLVEGKITTDTTAHYVILSRSTLLVDTMPSWVTDAELTITGNSNVLHLTEETPGHYYTDSTVFGVVGEEYELNIILSNGESYEAITHIPNTPEIDSVKMAWENWSGYGYYSHFVYYHGWELEEEGNAYLWNLYMDDTLYNDTIWKTTYVNDDFVNGSYIGYGFKRYFDSLDNRIDTIGSNFAIYELDPEDIIREKYKVMLEMESIPLEYYEFWVSFMSQTVWVGSPFDPAKANPVNNISNDALGYFYGATVRRYSFVYEPPKWSIGFKNPEF